jgi:hypothetical protein
MPVETPQGVRQDMAHAGGRSQAEERLREAAAEERLRAAAAILGISCRRKAMYGGLFRKTKMMSVPGVELVGKQHQGGLTSEPPRRQDTSPGGRSNLGRQGGRSRRKERTRKPRAEGFD